jgi:hypothetical protein
LRKNIAAGIKYKNKKLHTKMADVLMIESDDDFVVQSDGDSDFDFDDGENAAPVVIIAPKKKAPAKKKAAAKKPAASKKAAGGKKKAATAAEKKQPLGDRSNLDNTSGDEGSIDINDDDIDEDDTPASTANEISGGKKKTIEQRYQKKTQLEHILLRPDTYSK